MNRHWPVNAMVIVGFSKYEGASSNPAADNDVVVAYSYQTLDCRVSQSVTHWNDKIDT